MAVVVGGSAGGFEALSTIFSALPPGFELPIFVVQHLHPSDNGSFARSLDHTTCLSVVEPCDKEKIDVGHVFVAPANYHMLVERDGSIALCVNGKVNWSRPSIDVLFESAARAWGGAVIGVLLTGASSDGARGMRALKDAGALTIAQNPAGAHVAVMPQSAIDADGVVEVLNITDIAQRLIELGALHPL